MIEWVLGGKDIPVVQDQIRNGPNPFTHPVTGQMVGPYEFYQGFAHQDHEEGLTSTIPHPITGVEEHDEEDDSEEDESDDDESEDEDSEEEDDSEDEESEEDEEEEEETPQPPNRRGNNRRR